MKQVMDVEQISLLDCGKTAKGGPFIKLGFHWKDMPLIKRELKCKRVKIAAMDKSQSFKFADECRVLKIADTSPWMILETEHWELFNGYQDEVFYVGISVLDDDEHVTKPQKKAAEPKGPYGKFARYLVSHGFFDSPRVREVLQAPNDLTAAEVKELFKANIGSQLNCRFESLTEISPADVRRWINAYDVIFTIPAEMNLR